MKKGIWTVLVIFFLMFGCREETYNIKIRYNKTTGLEKGSPAFYNGKSVGIVDRIEKSGTEKSMVTVSIAPDKNDILTEYVTFAMIENPREKNKNAIEIRKTRDGGAILPSGSVVDGLEKEPLSLLDQLKKETKKEIANFKEHVSGLSKGWDDFIQEMRQIPEKKAVKELEFKMKALAQKMKESNQEWKEKIQKDLLPKLQKELNRLRERLREKGREKEMEPLEIRMDELQQI